jgi:parallel beta-helix repeat protein
VSGNTIQGSRTYTLTGILNLYSSSIGYFNTQGCVFSDNNISGVNEECLSFDQSNSAYIDGGTATSGGNTALNDTGKTWSTNSYSNYYVAIVSGTGAGQYRQISSNTSNALTVIGRWSTNPDATSVYIICAPFVDNVVSNNTIRDYDRHGIVLYGACLNNTVVGNTVQEGCKNQTTTDPLYGIGVWGVYRGNTGAPANDRQPAWYNTVIGNSVSKLSSTLYASIRYGVYLHTHDATNGAFAANTADYVGYGNIVTGNVIGPDIDVGACVSVQKLAQVHGNVINARFPIDVDNVNWASKSSDNRIENNSVINTSSGIRVNGTSQASTTQGIRTTAAAPTLTPFFIGEDVLDAVNNKWYKSKGLTAADWLLLN